MHIANPQRFMAAAKARTGEMWKADLKRDPK
jgi:hypothetical protein